MAGRPPIGAPTTIRLGDELRARVDEQCANLGGDLGLMIRELLTEALDRREGPTDEQRTQQREAVRFARSIAPAEPDAAELEQHFEVLDILHGLRHAEATAMSAEYHAAHPDEPVGLLGSIDHRDPAWCAWREAYDATLRAVLASRLW